MHVRCQLLVYLCLCYQTLSAQFDFDLLGELYPDDFFNPPSMADLSLSPSGDKLIYSSFGSGNFNFYMVDTKTLKKESYYGAEAEKSYINFVEWKDEKRIIFQTEGGNVYLLDLDENYPKLLFDSERVWVGYYAVIWGNFSLPAVISLQPNDPNAILVSAYDEKGIRQVYRVDLKTQEHKILFKNSKRYDAFYADHEGEVRMAMKYDTRGLDFYYRAVGSKKWIPFDKVFKGMEGAGFDLDKSNITQRRDYFLGFDFNPDQFYFASNRVTDTTAIYKYDIPSKALVEEVAHDPVYDFVDVTEMTTYHLVSKKNKRWLGFYINRDKPIIHWIDPAFKELQAKVDAHLPGSENLILDWNYDETIFLVTSVFSNRSPGNYLYRAEDDTLTLLGHANEGLLEVEIPASQPITYTSRDGMKIEGYFTPAKTEGDEVAPVVMLVHGGPWVRDSYGYDPIVQWLAYKGYSVMQVNYRGSTGYGYQHFYAIKDDFGLGVQGDIEDGLHWAAEQGWVDKDRAAIMGISYGGYATMLALTTKPEVFKCGVAISGVYDLVQASKTLKKQSNKGLSYESWTTMVGKEWRDRKRLEQISPVNLVEDMTKPLFLAHGKLDQVVLFQQVEFLKEALEDHGKDFEFMALEDEGHGFVIPRNQATLFGAVVEFLDKNLKP